MSTPGFIRLLTCAHGRQAEQRARLNNPVISIWHAAVDAYLKAKDAKESKR